MRGRLVSGELSGATANAGQRLPLGYANAAFCDPTPLPADASGQGAEAPSEIGRLRILRMGPLVVSRIKLPAKGATMKNTPNKDHAGTFHRQTKCVRVARQDRAGKALELARFLWRRIL